MYFVRMLLRQLCPCVGLQITKKGLLLASFLLCTTGLDARQGPQAVRPLADGAGHARTILVLFSEDGLQPATQAMERGILDAVASLDQAESPRVFFEYLDATQPTRDRCPDDVMADLLRDKYTNRHIDVVIPVGEDAIEFAHRRHRSLWPSIPILFVATHNMRVDATARLPGASGLVFQFPFAEALAIARKVAPDTRHVAIVSGSSELEMDRTAGYADDVRRAGLDFIDLSGLRLPEVLDRVGRLPHQTVIFFAGPLVDADGRRSSAWRLCETISAASTAPTFTTAALQLLGCGTTGGRMRDFRAIGRRVGERGVAMRAAAPHRVDVIPVAQFTTVTFDARQLDRWHIPDRNLPPGSIVGFQRFSRWASYRTPIIVGAFAIGAQLFLLVAFMWLRPVATAAHRGPTLRERRLVGVVTQELIGPLSALQLNVEATDRLLGREPLRLDAVREIVHDLRGLSQRFREILIRYGALRSASSLRAESLEFGSLIIESLNRVPESVRRTLQVNVDEAASQAIILADAPLLVQAITSVVFAAAESVPHGASDERRVSLHATSYAERAVITVTTRVNRTAIDADAFDVLVGSRRFDVAIDLLAARDVIEAHAGTVDAELVSSGQIAVHLTFGIVG